MENLYQLAGLTKTDDGQWIGTHEQWQKLEELEEEASSQREEQKNEETCGKMDF